MRNDLNVTDFANGAMIGLAWTLAALGLLWLLF